MPPICYLLVERSSTEFSPCCIESTQDIPIASDFQLLFEDATIAIRAFKHLDPAQKIQVSAFKVVFHLDYLTISFPTQPYSATQAGFSFS